MKQATCHSIRRKRPGGRSPTRQHVHRVSETRRGWKERGQACDGPVRQARELQAPRIAGIGCEDVRPAGVRQDRDAFACGQRLVCQQRADVKQLLHGVGTDHARVAEERLDRDVARRQRPRMRRSGTRAAGRPAALDDSGRLLPAHTPRDPAESPRIAEALDVEQDHGGMRIGFPVLEQVVRRNVRLVPDRREGRDAQIQLRRRLEHRETERAALAREADGS
jgi:hypothetical protein